MVIRNWLTDACMACEVHTAYRKVLVHVWLAERIQRKRENCLCQCLCGLRGAYSTTESIYLSMHVWLEGAYSMTEEGDLDPGEYFQKEVTSGVRNS